VSKAPQAPRRKKEEDKENDLKGKAKAVKKVEREGGNAKVAKPGPKSRKLAPLSASASNQQSKVIMMLVPQPQ